MSRLDREPPGPGHLGHVAVIGGALRGLVAASELAKAGAQVTVFEASRQWGGPNAYFRRGARFPEKFFDTVLPTDDHLLALLDELEADRPRTWSRLSTGILHGGGVHRLNGLTDLLRLRVLPTADRLRLARLALEVRHRSLPTALDAITARRWLSPRLGFQAYRSFAEPLLRARFGQAHELTSALRLHSLLRRATADRRRRGYVREGSHGIAEGLLRTLRDAHARMVLGAQVTRVRIADDLVHVHATGVSGTYDRLILAVPEPVVADILDPTSSTSRAVPEIDYLGALSVYLEVAKSVIPFDRLLVHDDRSPFQEILEATRIVERVESRDPHVVYLTARTQGDAPILHADPFDVVRHCANTLLDLVPSLQPEDILHGECFRARFAEPVCETGFFARQPAPELVPGRVYLATRSQGYPLVPSWNTSVRVGQDAARALVDGAARAPRRRLVTAS